MDDVTAQAVANTAEALKRQQAAGKKKKGWAKSKLNEAKGHRPGPVRAAAAKGTPAAGGGATTSSFLGGTVPWWVIFLLCVYFCVKLMGLYESPCAILGVDNPATKRSINKAYRSLSKCTHPDRLLKFGTEAQQRGEVLFRRIASAKEQITHQMQVERASNVSCYTGGGPFATEAAVLAVVRDALGTSDGREYTGVMLGEIGQGLVEVVTLEHGFVALAILALTTMTIARHCCALRREASQQSCSSVLLRIPLVVLVGPLEVAWRLFTVPIVRWGVFVDSVVPRARNAAATDNAAAAAASGSAGDAGGNNKAKAAAGGRRSTAGISVAGPSVGPRRRQGKGKTETTAQRTEREANAVVGREAALQKTTQQEIVQLLEDEAAKQRKRQQEGPCARVLLGAAARFPPLRGLRRLHGAASSQSISLDPSKLPPGVQLKDPSLGQGDDFAAGAVQNDFVLNVTKPIIPLALLIGTGEYISGFWSSLVIMSVLQRLPKMGAGGLHLALFFFGLVHTFLEADAVHRVETSAGDMQVVLKWQWSLGDVMLAANLVLMGATFGAVSRNGNSPGLLSSFASGVAVRILASMLTPPAAAAAAADAWEALFPADEMLVQFQPNSEVSSWAGGGVGDCGGGPLRMFFGGRAAAVDVALRAFLLVLPALHAAQWFGRIRRELVSGRRRRGRVLRVARQALFALGALAQCFLVVRLTLDGLNGSLIGFFAVLVFATHVESLLHTYDVRGSVRQVLNYVIFVLL